MRDTVIGHLSALVADIVSNGTGVGQELIAKTRPPRRAGMGGWSRPARADAVKVEQGKGASRYSLSATSFAPSVCVRGIAALQSSAP